MTRNFFSRFELAGSEGDGLHPYLSAAGAFHGEDVALLEKDDLGRWRPRSRPVLEDILSGGYGFRFDLSRRMQSLEAVAKALNDNNPSRAAIALVHAQFPPLPDAGASLRMAKADALAKAGTAYLTQPRIPAGAFGAGQWTTDGTGTALASLAARSLPYLLHMGARIAGPTALAAGVLFPTNESLESQGNVPGHPGLNYRFSEMHLTLIQNDGDGGARLLFSGMPDKDDLYRDRNGTIVGRAVGNSLMLDNAGVSAMKAATARDDAAINAFSAADETSDQPKLCPDPSPDRPGGRRERNIAYEQQINGGLPLGMAIVYNGVYFDGCRTTDGTLLEAKGPGYDWALTDNGDWQSWYEGKLDLWDQLKQQSEAAGDRPVEWHVAEPRVAENLRAYVQAEGYANIQVIYTPVRAK